MNDELKRQWLTVFKRVVLTILAMVMIIERKKKQGLSLEKWVEPLHGDEGMLPLFTDGITKEYLHMFICYLI